MVLKPMVAVLTMGAFVYYFINFNVIIVILLAAVVYMAMLLVLKTFSKEEIEMFKSVIPEFQRNDQNRYAEPGNNSSIEIDSRRRLLSP